MEFSHEREIILTQAERLSLGNGSILALNIFLTNSKLLVSFPREMAIHSLIFLANKKE